MGQLITLHSKLGGTTGKMIRFTDIGGLGGWTFTGTKNFAQTADTFNTYRKDVNGWPSGYNYKAGWSLYDISNKWSKNTFYTGNNNTCTFPSYNDLIDYSDAVSWSESEGSYRIITDDEVEKTRLLDNISVNTMRESSQAYDWHNDMTDYAPSIFLRFYTINDSPDSVNGDYGSLRHWMPGLDRIFIFIDDMGTSGGQCLQFPGHTSLNEPLKIPIADFAFKWYINTNHSYNTHSTWFEDANEHWIYLNNVIKYLPSSGFYAIILFVPQSSAVIPGRMLKLPVGYNNRGDAYNYSSTYLELKACRITYGNYMFDPDGSGSTTVSGYGWGGLLYNDINSDPANNGGFSSVRWHNGRYDLNIVKSDTGGWTE